MSAAAARSEAVKNSMFPGVALIYLVGSELISRLRAEAEAGSGGAFELRAFHDRFLGHGSLPVSLITSAMVTA